jgi:hypothetical protein
VTRKYSDDRLAITQEIAEGLKMRGHWVPSDTAGPDLITAIFKAIEDQKKTLLECRDALLNVEAYFMCPLSHLAMKKHWSQDHTDIVNQTRDLIRKLPRYEPNGEISL